MDSGDSFESGRSKSKPPKKSRKSSPNNSFTRAQPSSPSSPLGRILERALTKGFGRSRRTPEPVHRPVEDPQKLRTWDILRRKFHVTEQLELAQFKSAQQLGTLGTEDVPGSYCFQVHGFDGISSPLLRALRVHIMGLEFTLTHSTLTQHTISWEQPVVHPSGTVMPPGTCNIYQFPAIAFGSGWASEATGATLEVLCWVMTRAAAEPQRVFWRTDASGGYLIHALLIANTPAALKLVHRLVITWPHLLVQGHRPGPFWGETILHILAVNNRVEDMCSATSRVRTHTATALQT